MWDHPLSFFLSCVANTQPNHWTKRTVITRLSTYDPRNCPGPLPTLVSSLQRQVHGTMDSLQCALLCFIKPIVRVCCFVFLNRHWRIVTVPLAGFHHERAKGDAPTNRIADIPPQCACVALFYDPILRNRYGPRVSLRSSQGGTHPRLVASIPPVTVTPARI